MPSRSVLRLLIVLIALSTVISVFQRDLFVGDETKYAQVIRGMESEHSVLVPVLNGEPYSHKPPLHFWLVYVLAQPFGIDSPWPFIIPSLIGFVALLLIVHFIGRELFDHGTALLSAFILGTIWLIWGMAQTARMDLEFTAFISAAVLYVYRFLERERTRDLSVAGVLVGIAILFKGPMAFVIVLLVLVFEMIRRRRIPRGRYLPFFALAAGIPLLWVIPAVLRGGKDYAEELLIKQNIGRAVQSWVHKEPLWYYIAHFPGIFFPWFFVAILAIAAVWLRNHDEEEASRLRFCVSWILAVFLPFSIISGKLDVYMVPAAIPLALVTARFLTGGREDRLARIGALGNGAVVLILLAIGIVVPFVRPYVQEEGKPELALLGEPVIQGLWIGLAIVAAAGLVAILMAKRDRLVRSSVVLAIVAVFPLLYLAAFLMPQANELASTRPMVRALANQPYHGSQIALYASPYLWSRNLPPSLEGVRYIGERGLTESGPEPPILVASQRSHAPELGLRLSTDYVKIDEFRMRGKWFDLYRRR